MRVDRMRRGKVACLEKLRRVDVSVMQKETRGEGTFKLTMTDLGLGNREIIVHQVQQLLLHQVDFRWREHLSISLPMFILW